MCAQGKPWAHIIFCRNNFLHMRLQNNKVRLRSFCYRNEHVYACFGFRKRTGLARFVSARRAARRFIAFSLAGALVCACMPFAAYADVETDVAKGKEAIVKMTELTYELEITNEDLNEVEARITELDAEINKIKGEIEDTEAEYEAAQEQLALLSKARYTDGQTMCKVLMRAFRASCAVVSSPELLASSAGKLKEF